MSNLTKRIAGLPLEKRKLLLEKLRQKKGKGSQEEIRPQSRESNTFPLSYAQQRLWFLDQLISQSSVYNFYGSIRLVGELDVDALQQTFHEIVRRHEVLRTTFVSIDGEPRQVISETHNVTLSSVDLSMIPAASREKEVQQQIKAAAEQPFELADGPLIRATLFRLSLDEHILLVVAHHIVVDETSMIVSKREMSLLYEAFSFGNPSPLEELPIQYADFACWQQEYLSGEVLDSQLAYWKQQLANLSPLELPTDRPRKKIQTFESNQQLLVIPELLSEKLLNLSREEGATLYMMLLAAFKTLLYRYT